MEKIRDIINSENFYTDWFNDFLFTNHDCVILDLCWWKRK